MGVEQLLTYVQIDGLTITQLKKEPTHISSLLPLTENKYCFIDASAIIHIALRRCTGSNFLNALEIARGIHVHHNGGSSDALETEIVACFKQAESNCTTTLGCTPVFVFDGDVPIPKRQEKEVRTETAAKAFHDWQELDSQRASSTEGVKLLSKACTRTWEHTRIAVGACMTMRAEYYVAPYEADSQIVYLCRLHGDSGFIAAEDSDFLVYPGVNICFSLVKDLVKANPSVFKVCMFTTKHRAAFFESRSLNDDLFIAYALLKGCDYTKHLHASKKPLFGVRVDKLMQIVSNHLSDCTEMNSCNVLEALHKAIGNSKYNECEEAFKAGLHAYKNSWVFDRTRTRCVSLAGENDMPHNEVEIAGPPIEKDIIPYYSNGEYDPFQKRRTKLQAYGVCDVPEEFKRTYMVIKSNMWHQFPYLTSEKMIDFFGIAAYTKGRSRTSAHIQNNNTTTVMEEAKSRCQYKWMGISVGAEIIVNEGRDTYVCASIPRSQRSSSMKVYALLSKNEDGEFVVRKGYCICPLGLGGKCVHVACLVWTVVQQNCWAEANDLEKYKYDPSIALSESEDDTLLCTSNPSKWDVPSFLTGNVDEDVLHPIHLIIIENPKTIANRQDYFAEKVHNGNANQQQQRKVRASLTSKAYVRPAMVPLNDVLFKPMVFEGSHAEFWQMRRRHWALYDDVAKLYHLGDYENHVDSEISDLDGEDDEYAGFLSDISDWSVNN